MNHLRKIIQRSRPIYSARYLTRILVVDYDDIRGENPKTKTDILHIDDEQFKKLNVTMNEHVNKSDDNVGDVKDMIIKKTGMKKNLFIPFMSEHDYNVGNIEITNIKCYNLEEL